MSKCQGCGSCQIQRQRVSRWRSILKCRRCSWYIYNTINYMEYENMVIIKKMLGVIDEKRFNW